MSLFTRSKPDLGDESSPDDEKTVQLARRRFVRRQWARRWLAWRRVVLVVVLLVLLATAGWLVFLSPVLAVSGVQVVGTQSLSPATVRAAASVPLGGPVATADLDAISRRVERLPAVKSVDVSRSWPDHVLVDVTERRPVAVVAGGGPGDALRGVDRAGVLFRQYPTRPRRLPMIRTGQRTGTDALAEAATVAGALPATLAHRVGYIEVRTVDDISLELRNGRTVRWGSADDSADKGRVLDKLLGVKASFYDVSVPGQPIIRR